MARINRIGRIRRRISLFLRKSRHRAWRIHWRVTMAIVLLILSVIGCVTYYFEVIQPRSFKYSYYDHEIQDFIYYVEKELKNPLHTDYHFYLSEETYQNYAEPSNELVKKICELKEGDHLFVGGVIEYHF